MKTLEIQLQRILQHFPQGIPLTLGERLQDIIKSNVLPTETNITKTKKLETNSNSNNNIVKETTQNQTVPRDHDTRLNHDLQTKNKTKTELGRKINFTDVFRNNTIPIAGNRTTAGITTTTPALGTDRTNNSEWKDPQNVDNPNRTRHTINNRKTSHTGTTSIKNTKDTKSRKIQTNSEFVMEKVIARKHPPVDKNLATESDIEQIKHGHLKIVVTNTSKISNATKSHNANRKPEKPIMSHNKSKVSPFHSPFNKGKKDSNSHRTKKGMQHGLPKTQIRNVLSLKTSPQGTTFQRQSVLKTKFKALAGNSIKTRSSNIGVNLHHSNKPEYKKNVKEKGLSNKHFQQKQIPVSRPFPNLRPLVQSTNVKQTNNRKLEMSTKIFSFSLPRNMHRNLPRKIRTPSTVRQTKSTFSLMPLENQITRSRNSRKTATSRTKNKGTENISVLGSNSWKRPVPEIHISWENKPNTRQPVTPPVNALFNQRNIHTTPPSQYHYDSFTFQDTFQINGQYPQILSTRPPSHTLNGRQNHMFSSGHINKLQGQERPKSEIIKINFQGSNMIDKPSAGTASDHSQTTGNKNIPFPPMTGGTPEPWSSNKKSPGFSSGISGEQPQWSQQKGVVYSNIQDNTPKQNWNDNNQAQSPQSPMGTKNSQFQNWSSHPSVVYSTYQGSSNLNWNTSSPNQSKNIQGSNFQGKSSGSNPFVYTTTPSSYYNAPLPSMSAPPNSLGAGNREGSKSYTPKFTQDTMIRKQGFTNWNEITTPLYPNQNSEAYSKPMGALARKQNPPTEITIAPNFLFHQEQTTQYPYIKGNSVPEGNWMNKNSYNSEMPQFVHWSTTVFPAPPTTPGNAFLQQESPGFRPGSNAMFLNKNINAFRTTTPSIVSQQFREPNQPKTNLNFQPKQIETYLKISEQQYPYQNIDNSQQPPLNHRQQQTNPNEMQRNQINHQSQGKVSSLEQQPKQAQGYTGQMIPSNYQQQQGSGQQGKPPLNQQTLPQSQTLDGNPGMQQYEHQGERNNINPMVQQAFQGQETPVQQQIQNSAPYQPVSLQENIADQQQNFQTREQTHYQRPTNGQMSQQFQQQNQNTQRLPEGQGNGNRFESHPNNYQIPPGDFIQPHNQQQMSNQHQQKLPSNPQQLPPFGQPNNQQSSFQNQGQPMPNQNGPVQQQQLLDKQQQQQQQQQQQFFDKPQRQKQQQQQQFIDNRQQQQQQQQQLPPIKPMTGDKNYLPGNQPYPAQNKYLPYNFQQINGVNQQNTNMFGNQQQQPQMQQQQPQRQRQQPQRQQQQPQRLQQQQMQQQQPRNYQNKPPVKQNNFNNQQQPYNPQFPNQPPLFQQPTNNRNMKIFPVNQQPRRQRKKRIPAPAYV